MSNDPHGIEKSYDEWEVAFFAERAKLFRDYRKAHGWSQKDAAIVHGVTQPTISCWERKGSYNDITYRQIYESDWGQAMFNPQWPNFFVRCDVGYDKFCEAHFQPIPRPPHVVN